MKHLIKLRKHRMYNFLVLLVLLFINNLIDLKILQNISGFKIIENVC